MKMMLTRRKGFLVLLLTVGSLAWATPASAQFGVSAGANFNNLDDIDTGSANATFERSTGYHAGAFLQFGSGSLSVSPGVFYHRIGTYDFGPEPTDPELDLSAIEVPVDLRYELFSLNALGGYVLGAPVLTFARTDEEFSDAVEDLSLTADLGAGVAIDLPGDSFSLMPELRYSVGVTDYMSDEFEVGDTTVTPAGDQQRVSKVMLRLNLLF